jgi:DNA-binding XRE family transcriptional regulator
MKTFGHKLRSYRKEYGISQATLSKQVNIPQTTISDFENNKYLPNIYQAIAFAKFFKISVYDFANEDLTA